MLRLIDLGAEFWKNYFGSGANAATGYELTIEKLDWHWKDHQRTVVCCDSPVSLRRDYEPTYKANRKPKPTDGIDALVACEERAKAWGMPVAKCDGYEADDLIATLVSQVFLEEVQIIGDEKDLFALISEGVSLYGKKGKITLADCVDKFGVHPSQMTEWLALCGDTSDNIRGCENMGQFRATVLLERFDTIANAQAATDGEILDLPKFGPKTLAGFRAWDPAQAMRLVQLMTDAPISLEALVGELEQ